MPKGTVKKKRYNARFPPARIKKIMQMDEEVGKVAAAVPVIISRALEMFIESLVTETSKVTHAKNAKTLSTSHIKQTITGTKQFDFLRDLVKNVPDHQAEDNGETSCERDPSAPKRGRGRPKASDSVKKSKPRGNKSSSEEEDEDGDNDAEDTETDEEATNGGTSYSETYNKESPADRKPNTSFVPTDVQPSVSYPSGFNQSVQQPGMKPNIDQLIQAASSLQQQQQQQQYLHSPLQPPVCDIALSHNNNNDNNFNYAPPSAFGSASHPGLSVMRDSLISGNNIAPLLHHQSLPLSAPCVLPPPPPSSFPQPKQPMYQMPSNFDSPQSSLFSLQLPSKVSFNNSSSNALSSPPYLQSPVSQKLSQQQQQPVDLSHPLKQITKEEDDYDT